MTDDSEELERLINESIKEESASKRAIETLHPEDEEKKDRLTILTDAEVTAHTVVEWMTKALKTPDHTRGFIIEGLSDKAKAMKVSRAGVGRGEIQHIMKPEVLGELLGSGWLPPATAMQGLPGQKRGFFSRFFGGNRMR